MPTALPLNDSGGIRRIHRGPLPDSPSRLSVELDPRVQLHCLWNARLVLNVIGEKNLLPLIGIRFYGNSVRAVGQRSKLLTVDHFRDHSAAGCINNPV